MNVRTSVLLPPLKAVEGAGECNQHAQVRLTSPPPSITEGLVGVKEKT